MVLVELLYENQETTGCEYLKIEKSEKNIIIESTTVYLDTKFKTPFKINYQLKLNQLWETTFLKIENGKSKELELTSNGKGKWFDHNGKELTELNGAIDVDISSTPFSNSLPINRFVWRINQKRDFLMVFISIPSLKIRKVPQSYTLMAKNRNVKVFKYESKNYSTFISVDEAGYVIDYPNVFNRK